MYWTPCGLASCPLSGIGFRWRALRSAITAPAMLSFAAMAASILLFVLTSICAKIGPAFVASQSGTNCCGPFVNFPLLKSGFKTASFPLLNQNAFWSVGPPQSSATTGFVLPLSPATMRKLVLEAGPIRDVHSVRVRETPQGLVVNFHCRADPSLSVEAVHHAVDELERRLRNERDDIHRVIGHAEPSRAPDAVKESAQSSR